MVCFSSGVRREVRYAIQSSVTGEEWESHGFTKRRPDHVIVAKGCGGCRLTSNDE